MSLSGQSMVIFVGRQQKVADPEAALGSAQSGRGQLLMLVCEPGIGKTRTAQQLAHTAQSRGTQVLWGRCYEQHGMPPFWPWVQALRSYVQEHSSDELRALMGAGAADIAEIVPEIRERLPGLLPSARTEEPEHARFCLFDSITIFLKAAAQKKPLVLILDDLHWADKPSLLLLEFLAQELSDAPLLVVGTYRDMELSRQHPLADNLGELTRNRVFHRILLPRLYTLHEVDSLMSSYCDEDSASGLSFSWATRYNSSRTFFGNKCFIASSFVHSVGCFFACGIRSLQCLKLRI